MTANDLCSEFRLCFDGSDPWGSTMAWWFAVAGEMYARGLPIPAAWRYRPSPMGARDPDAYETPICEAADDVALILFGRMLARYATCLKKGGMDY